LWNFLGSGVLVKVFTCRGLIPDFAIVFISFSLVSLYNN
jgi:hypothetical protein